jgi:hypothetical protein
MTLSGNLLPPLGVLTEIMRYLPTQFQNYETILPKFKP